MGDRGLASFSLHGTQMIFRGKITVFNSCHQAATELGLGRQGGVGAPILAAFDQEMAVGLFIRGGEFQGWDFSPGCNSRQSLAWRALP